MKLRTIAVALVAALAPLSAAEAVKPRRARTPKTHKATTPKAHKAQKVKPNKAAAGTAKPKASHKPAKPKKFSPKKVNRARQ